MRIIFKNVGQGDSIILHWPTEIDSDIGIIDCAKINGLNPVLEHLKVLEVESIKFLILSHPHYDHFSGYLELLNYCENEGVVIENFSLTCYQDIVYLKTAVKSARATSELAKLLLKIRALREKGLIRHIIHLNSDTKVLKLNSDINIETLSPTTDEMEAFAQKKYSASEENQDSQPYGNWLSTVLKIYSNNWYILLTSDVEKSVIKRIGHDQKDIFNQNNLILGQAPHHGSLNNHSSEFWRNLKRKDPKIAISVGDNSYGHPSPKVLKKFEDYKYEIYSTNKVGGLLNKNIPEKKESEVLLHNIDIYDSAKELQNDLVFRISSGIAKFSSS